MSYVLYCKYQGRKRLVRMKSFKRKKDARAAIRRAKRVRGNAPKLICRIRKG